LTNSRRLLPEVLGLVADGRLDPLAVPVTTVDSQDADRAWLPPATKLVLLLAVTFGDGIRTVSQTVIP